MKYCIVRWLPHERSWVILHYSHLYKDAIEKYNYYTDRFHDIKLMIEIDAIHKEEAKSIVDKYVANLIKRSQS